ncbi:agamous-like MADS-box protein AGL80 [Carex littledalei]|uniref:Agamous-like MADS-box protein AGL80 n=1 Tax=Carex littledalei TaxID=544730 RepID=A0A833QY16_9POAL|nr:agamous-like MADS-box protein AGL80 [Carex littledalei]
MVRKKAVIEPIATSSARRTTFKKRKASLFKKAMELSTLCRVDVCAVVSEGPHDPNPDTWPPRENAMRILSCFSGMPEADKSKKMVDRVGYLSQQMEKLQLQLRKVQSENCELENAILLQEVLSGQSCIADVASFERMSSLAGMVERRLGEINKRMRDLASAPVLHRTALDMWAPLTTDLALEERGQDAGARVFGPTSDYVAPIMVGPQVEDEIERFFNSNSIYGCDDEITALLSS